MNAFAEHPKTCEVWWGGTCSCPSATIGPELEVLMAADVDERRVAYLWAGRIPIGAATLLPGEEGIGKTLIGIRLMADLTRGTLSGEYQDTSRNVVVMAPEDGIADVFRPRLREAGADLNRVAFVTSRKTGDDHDEVILPRDLPLLTKVVRRLDAALVWIDSLVTTLPDELKSISYKDTAKVLKALSGWAETERVALAAPWHLNKNAGTDTAVRIMDSRAFRTAVRSMLLIVADPDAPEGVQQGIVALDKANAGTLNVPALRYRIRSAPYTVTEIDRLTGELRERPTSCGVADWLGQVSGDGRALARDALAPRIEKDGGPKQWLREYLTEHGPTARTQVLTDAADEHSAAGIKRAAAALRVHSEEITGRHADGRPFRHAVWSLQSAQPRDDTQTTEPTEPTGESAHELIDLISAGQPQSAQSAQSAPCHRSEPTGRRSEPTGESADRTRLVGMTRDQIEAHGQALRQQVIGLDGQRTP